MSSVISAPNAIGPQPHVKRTSWQIQRAVIFAMLLRELKTRFEGRLVGVFWVLFEPLVHIALMMVLRVVLRERFFGVMIDVPVYLASAMIPFFMFRNIWMRVMDSISSNRGLLAYRQVKPFDAMIGRAILEIVLYSMVYVVLCGVFAWIGYQYLPHEPLEYMGMVSMFIFMGMGLGVISAVIANVMPGVRTFIRLLSFPLYMMSGVIVSIERFPRVLREYLMWNPLLHMVELMRTAFFHSHRPLPGTNLEFPMVVMFGILFLAACMYRVRRQRLLSRA